MSSCCSPKNADLHSAQTNVVERHRATEQIATEHTVQQEPQGEFAHIPAGTFSMGDHWGAGYPADGETPVHDVQLDSFLLGATTVTNAEFARFVSATGYRTTAEEFGVSAVFYAAFQGPQSAILHQVTGTPWWLAVRGADWKHPNGPGSDITSTPDHPVVHVSWHDAMAYCKWNGSRLPTEAEWEYAARGGLEKQRYAWGNTLEPDGRWNCNIWQGEFPTRNTAEDGYLTTAPVKTYQPNGYGLWQMAGNVWEWCHDWFNDTYYSNAELFAPAGPASGEARVMRGGSYLCHDSYCNRYRVSARNSNTPNSTAGNIGFRCVISA